MELFRFPLMRMRKTYELKNFCLESLKKVLMLELLKVKFQYWAKKTFL